MALWQEARKWWSRPVPNMVALRRAWGRALYNRRRQEQAYRRRRYLVWLLYQEGYRCGASLVGVGTGRLYERYRRETGASRRTFFADLALVRTLYAEHHAGGERGMCACYTGHLRVAPPSRAPGRRATAAAWQDSYVAFRLALERQAPLWVQRAVELDAKRIVAYLKEEREAWRKWLGRAKGSTS